MTKQPTTMEAQYVSKTVGPAIAQGLAEIVQRKPVDPVEYLANFLYKFVENQEQQSQDKENENMIKKLRKEKDIEEKRQAEMKREQMALRDYEEELRKEKEAEERRIREMEELAKRKQEISNLAPALPSLSEEEENSVVEFGETKLHQLASTADSKLASVLKENYNSFAARNSQLKTPRDLAVELNLTENVQQIDEFIYELVTTENLKQLTDLIILGFDDLFTIVETQYGNSEQMEEKGLGKSGYQIFTVLPQIQAKISDLKNFVEAKDLESLKANLTEKKQACYRDAQGKTSLHTAIEKGYFEIAMFLLEKCPLLSKLNDANEKYPADYLKEVDTGSIEETEASYYETLCQLLK